MEELLVMLFGKVISASDGEKAYKLYKEELPDIILSDVQMPNSNGLNLIKQIRTHDHETPIVLLTSFSEEELLLTAKHLSFNGYLSKPITLEKLISTLCKAMDLNDTD